MEDKKRIGPKRILFDLPEELHSVIKSNAAMKNIPMRTYIMRALLKYINEDKKYQG